MKICCVLLVCVYFALIAKCEDSTSENSLKMALIVFRHGERNPILPYPNDPHRNHLWPGGYEALTKNGSLQLFNLGTKLRERYESLLSTTDEMYSHNDMAVLSSDKERTIMSAESLLAGFLPPPKNANLLPIPWQPVPVNVIPRDKDVLLMGSRPCFQYYKNIFKLLINPPYDYQKTINHVLPNETLYRYIDRNAGITTMSFIQLIAFFDTLEIEELNGLELPEWTNIIAPHKMRSFIERMYKMFTENFEMKRIRGGPLLTEIGVQMKLKNENRLNPNRKLMFYSGHDLTLLALIYALDIAEQTSRKPDYGAALTFELHETNSIESPNEFEVKLFYYPNTYVDQPTEVRVPKCSEPCTLTSFLNVLKPYSVFNYNKLCHQYV